MDKYPNRIVVKKGIFEWEVRVYKDNKKQEAKTYYSTDTSAESLGDALLTAEDYLRRGEAPVLIHPDGIVSR